MPLDGGYYLIKQPLIRGGFHEHTATDQDNLSDEMLRAVNVIQATPWRINAWVLDVLREAWASGDAIGGLPVGDAAPLPLEVPTDEWESMDKTQRSEVKYERTQIHESNAKAESRRSALARKVNVADAMRDDPAIYFPHFMDFRGRFYPMCQDLTPQGDDIARALLHFADGKPLGTSGQYWMAIRLANTAGQDKLSFKDRIAWVVDNEELIMDSGRDPLDGCRFWTEAEEPWSFLATCREWFLAHHDAPSPEEFVSHLPVPLDGTCNGLQHLSLMGRDPVGARATNCGAESERYDLYEEVAAVVRRLISEDAVAGVPEAHNWAGEVDRKTVKRAVMTTPYGVTDRGIQDQLVKDGHTNDLEGSKVANAKYLREKIVSALDETCAAAKSIMAYFQEVADVLAEDDVPLRWQTPSGMVVEQSYYQLSRREVSTLIGRVSLWGEEKEMGLNKRKQALASAPNVVHSYDAAMLAKTALACHDDWGITAFAFVHDSYGTHAADTGILADALRNEALMMYEPDQLQLFDDFVRSYAPRPDDLPPPPVKGDFDVREVAQAPYFFA